MTVVISMCPTCGLTFKENSEECRIYYCPRCTIRLVETIRYEEETKGAARPFKDN